MPMTHILVSMMRLNKLQLNKLIAGGVAFAAPPNFY